MIKYIPKLTCPFCGFSVETDVHTIDVLISHQFHKKSIVIICDNCEKKFIGDRFISFRKEEISPSPDSDDEI
jgi:hypothetical protein